MPSVFSLICVGPSFQKMTHHFLLHGSLWPTNLEKILKPCLLLYCELRQGHQNLIKSLSWPNVIAIQIGFQCTQERSLWTMMPSPTGSAPKTICWNPLKWGRDIIQLTLTIWFKVSAIFFSSLSTGITMLHLVDFSSLTGIPTSFSKISISSAVS